VAGVRAVVFDIGGVLVDYDLRRFCRQFLADDEEVEFFLGEVLGEAFHRERDLGVPMAQTAAEWSRRHPSYETAINAFNDRFPEMWLGSVPGSVEVLADLKAAGVEAYGLTNWGFETWALACAQFDFLGLLDGVLVSSEVGLVKPDPEIFLAFSSRFGVAPDEAAFVDDVVANVTAARALGFGGIVFTSAADLRHDLSGLGLLRGV